MRPATTTGVADPPVIAANGEPTKITPVDTATADNDPQNKLIYDRVNTDSGKDAAGATLVTPGAPSDTSAAPDDGQSAIARIILPGGPGTNTNDAASDSVGALAADDPAATGAADSGDETSDEIGPKKVRTVIVKPDGTIVSSGAVDAGQQATAAPAIPANPAPAADAPAAVADATPPVDDTAAISGANGELAVTPAPSLADADTMPAAKPATAPAAKQVAIAKPAPAPIDVTPAAKPASGGSGRRRHAGAGLLAAQRGSGPRHLPRSSGALPEDPRPV